MLKAQDALKRGVEVRHLSWSEREAEFLNKYLLLTSKPMVYLVNLSKDHFLSGKIDNEVQLRAAITFDGKHPAKIIPFSVEYEEERKNQDRSQIATIITAGYEELELCHFYTVGSDEVRAWAIRTGETAIEAGGKIHSDFTKGFISAEVIHADTLLKNPSLKDKLAKSSKKEGKNYVVKDGDIVHFNTKLK
jgi:obg-like ATPase 1